MPAFFKLGRKAISFFDQATGITITPGEVIKTKTTPKSRFFLNRLKGGAIVGATEAEYNKANGIEPPPPPDPPSLPASGLFYSVEELRDMTISEILEEVEEELDFSEEKMKELKKLKKEDLINAISEV